MYWGGLKDWKLGNSILVKGTPGPWDPSGTVWGSLSLVRSWLEIVYEGRVYCGDPFSLGGEGWRRPGQKMRKRGNWTMDILIG